MRSCPTAMSYSHLFPRNLLGGDIPPLGVFQKESYMIKCLFIRCWCLKSPKQDFSFNKGILTSREFQDCAGSTLSGRKRDPLWYHLITPLSSNCIHLHQRLVRALSPWVDTETALCIPSRPQRLPSLTLSTSSYWYHSSNIEAALFHVHWLTHSHFLSTFFMSGSCKTLRNGIWIKTACPQVAHCLVNKARVQKKKKKSLQCT